MKFKKLIALFMCLISVLCITGCDKDKKNYDDMVKVVYELEGGEYQNSDRAVTLYYNFEKGTENLIRDLSSISKKEVTKSGYHVEGWYRTKTVNGDTIQYLDKWDFETDKVSDDGVILYVKWLPNIIHAYDLVYKNDVGEDVLLHRYENMAGEKFDDFLNKANRFGFTPIGFEDENGNPWNNDFVHPGGEDDKIVKVYVVYLKGNFELVSTAKQLKRAKAKNIYLLNDIDMEGEKFTFRNFNSKKGYGYTILGNNYTISNFVIDYSDNKTALVDTNHLNISIFGNMNGATIKDVHFKDISLKIDSSFSMVKYVDVAPIAVSMKDTILWNVSFVGTYEIVRLPKESILAPIKTDVAFMENKLSDGFNIPIDDKYPGYTKNVENVTVNFTEVTGK